MSLELDYDNTEVASGVRDGDSSAEHQDVVAVDPVYKHMWNTVDENTFVCMHEIITPAVCICSISSNTTAQLNSTSMYGRRC